MCYSLLNASFIKSFSDIPRHANISVYYWNGKSISTEKSHSDFHEISSKTICKKVESFLNESADSGKSDYFSELNQIKLYEKLRSQLIRMRKHEKSGLLHLFKSTTYIDKPIDIIENYLNELDPPQEPKLDLNDEIISKVDYIAKTFVHVFHLDLDRASDNLPEIRGRSPYNSLSEIVNYLGSALDSTVFNNYERHLILQILRQLNDLLAFNENGNDRTVLFKFLDRIDTSEGSLFPGIFENHFAIIAIEPEINGTYRFSITNAGKGIWNNHPHQMGECLKFQTTLTFSHVPKDQVTDIAFFSQMLKGLPAEEGYKIIMRHLGMFLDPVSQNKDDFRKFQYRKTCATRSILKWIHQELHHKGCEATYRKLRYNWSLLNKEKLNKIYPEQLTKEEIDLIGDDIKLEFGPFNASTMPYFLHLVKQELNKSTEKRRKKIKLAL